MPSGDPRYEKYAAIGIAMRNSAAPEILRILVIPALPSVEGFSAVYVRRREKYHVEGQEGEVVAAVSERGPRTEESTWAP